MPISKWIEWKPVLKIQMDNEKNSETKKYRWFEYVKPEIIVFIEQTNLFVSSSTISHIKNTNSICFFLYIFSSRPINN